MPFSDTAELPGYQCQYDRLAGILLERYAGLVSRDLAQVVNTLDPDIFVMGGGGISKRLHGFGINKILDGYLSKD